MGAPEDWRHVVLAMGDETDIAQQHHLVISGNFLEGSLKQFLRVLTVAGEPLLIGADDAGRSFA
jgi:hypothetical protein